MKALVTAIAIGSIAAIGSPSIAGLGDAVRENGKEHAAWCGKKGNDCTVRFEDGEITVNAKDSVRFEDILHVTRNRHEKAGFWWWFYEYTFVIEYQEEGMDTPEVAEIIFEDEGAANSFWTDLKRACKNCKDDRNAPKVWTQEVEPQKPKPKPKELTQGCHKRLQEFGCSYEAYLDANPAMKKWAELNPELAAKEKVKLEGK